MVTGNTYRHPAVLAKMAVTIDHLSAGRLEFGIGAAWAEIEHDDARHRVSAPRAAQWNGWTRPARSSSSLWTEERTTSTGALHAERRDLEPEADAEAVSAVLDRRSRRAQDAARDRAARRRLERPGGEPDEVARLAGILDAHCADVGRDPAEIRRSVQIRYVGDDEALLRSASEFAARDVRDLIVILSPGQARAHAEAAAALVPRCTRWTESPRPGAGTDSRTERRRSAEHYRPPGSGTIGRTQVPTP